MKMKRPFPLKAQAFLAGLMAMILISGCAPIGIVIGAGATVGSMALEERGFDQSTRDSLAEARLTKSLSRADLNNFKWVSLEVVEGRVLAVGQVPTQEDRTEIIRILWEDEDTLAVINDVIIGPETSLIDTSHDAGIAAKFQALLVGDMEIRAVNFDAEVVGGRLSIIGIASDEGERLRVIDHAKTISHVREINDHILLRDEPKRQEILQKLAARKADQ